MRLRGVLLQGLLSESPDMRLRGFGEKFREERRAGRTVDEIHGVHAVDRTQIGLVHEVADEFLQPGRPVLRFKSKRPGMTTYLFQ